MKQSLDDYRFSKIIKEETTMIILDPCLSTINLTDLELENAFSTLKLNKNPECDDISPDVVKIVSMKYFLF